MMLVAGAIIVASGIFTYGVIFGVRRALQGLGDVVTALRLQTASQDRFTGALMAVSETNKMISGDNERLWTAIQHAKTNGKVA